MSVSLDPPSGWEVAIDAGAHQPTSPGGGHSLGETPMSNALARIHAANFALPAVRGDFGSGAVETMRANDILICVLEEDPAMATTALYRSEGVPSIAAVDFDPNRMQRPIKGQSGAQAFFHVDGRAFAAYVVLGSHRNRHQGVAEINRVLASLDLS